MVKKPEIWSRKVKGKIKLTQKAKEYLSFKLIQYYQRKRIAEEERKEIKAKTPIRVWVKFAYTGAKPLFIEAFVDGEYHQRDKMEQILIKTIEDNFGMEVAERSEIGFERIRKSTGKMAIRYKHNLSANWRYLR